MGDDAADLIALRRALPPATGMHARFGAEPSDGMDLPVPEDPSWRLSVRPDGPRWVITEVHAMPAALPDARRVLAAVDAEEAAGAIAAEFLRLQRMVRNAACGTPLDRQ